MIAGVIGAGAIGTLFASALARDFSVRVLVRDAAVADGIAARGGLLVDDEPPRPVHATHDARALADVAVVLVAVKAFATRDALTPLHAVLPRDAVIVSMQNGLDARDAIAESLGERAIALAPTTEAVRRIDAGIVRRSARGRTNLGWADGRGGDGAVLDRLATALARGGIATAVAAPIEPHVWAKLIANAAINPLTALAGLPNGALVESPELFERMAAIARESAAVARAAGVALPFADPVAFVSGVARATAANRSSMLADMERGRETEIEAIDGAVVRMARRFGVAVPSVERALDEVRARMRA